MVKTKWLPNHLVLDSQKPDQTFLTTSLDHFTIKKKIITVLLIKQSRLAPFKSWTNWSGFRMVKTKWLPNHLIFKWSTSLDRFIINRKGS